MIDIAYNLFERKHFNCSKYKFHNNFITLSRSTDHKCQGIASPKNISFWSIPRSSSIHQFFCVCLLSPGFLCSIRLFWLSYFIQPRTCRGVNSYEYGHHGHLCMCYFVGLPASYFSFLSCFFFLGKLLHKYVSSKLKHSKLDKIRKDFLYVHVHFLNYVLWFNIQLFITMTMCHYNKKIST